MLQYMQKLQNINLNKLKELLNVERNRKIQIILTALLVLIIFSISVYTYYKMRLNKLNCENLCKIYNNVYDLDTIIFRITNSFGPREQTISNKNAINYLIYRAFNGEQTYDTR